MSKEGSDNSKIKIEEYINDANINNIKLILQADKIVNIAKIIKNSNKIFICGNGGSAATASHFVNDLRKQCKLKASCLTDNISLFTAWCNDTSYDLGFMRQLETLAKKGDVLIVISGSGNSENLFNAVTYGNSIDMKTIGFVGMDGGRLKKNVKTTELIHIETDMLHSEDWHSTLCHLITNLIKREL